MYYYSQTNAFLLLVNPLQQVISKYLTIAMHLSIWHQHDKFWQREVDHTVLTIKNTVDYEQILNELFV